MKSLQRRLMEGAWRAVPDPRWALSQLGRAPRAMKGPILERIASVGLDIAHVAPDESLPTNFAERGPAVLIPRRAGSVYLYGNPGAHFEESATIRACRALLADADAFVDVGAHLGLFLFPLSTELSARKPGYFFEPNPELYRVLADNVQRLGLPIRGYDAALCDRDGDTTFFIDEHDWSMSTIDGDFAPHHPHHSVHVPCIRFETFAREANLKNALVKADIECGEWLLIDGMANSPGAVRHFVCEVLEDAWRQGFVERVCERMQVAAYRITDHGLVPGANVSGWHHAQRNWLFTSADPAWLQRVLRRAALHVASATRH